MINLILFKQVVPMRNRPSLKTILLAGCTVLFLFGIYKIGSYYRDAHLHKSELNQIKQVYYQLDKLAPPASVPSPQPEQGQNQPAVSSAKPVIQEAFQPLLAINPDVVGWIRIEGTTVDYPVVQSEDNSFYLDRGFDREPQAEGSIFMDYRNNISASDRHTILYGHNMKNKTMFASLLNYESSWYFKQHGTITFNTLNEESEWEIFSAYFTDTSHDYIRTDFIDEQGFTAFVQDIMDRSLHHSKAILTPEDRILTLSTCSPSGKDARFTVHARKIDKPAS